CGGASSGGASSGGASSGGASCGGASSSRGDARRVVAGGALAIVAAAGLGLLAAAVTVAPRRPPQPVAAQAIPVAWEPGVPLPAARPIRLEIPAIDVAADVIPVGLNGSNEVEVPSLDRPMQAGWYRLGVTPGERGNAVIVGHVDSEKVGPAVFFNLGKLQIGDEIRVSRVDGTVATFKVDGVQAFLKS